MDEPSIEVQCGFCGRKPIEQFIRVEVDETTSDLCDWACVAAFAMTRLKEMNDSANTRISDLRARVEELEYLVAQYRAQAGM